MFECLTLLVFLWLLLKTIGLVFRLTWGIAKLAAGLLIGLAFPALIVCFLFVGGIAMLIPIGLICIARGIVKSCV